MSRSARKSRTLKVVCVCVVCLLTMASAGVAYLYLGFDYPKFPAAWAAVEPGMTRGELAQVLGEGLDGWDLKGFDQLEHRSDDGDVWRLYIQYRKDGGEPKVADRIGYYYFDFDSDFGGRNVMEWNPDRTWRDRFAEK